MKRFVIHCPDEESVNNAREFFTKLFGPMILRNNRNEIETKYGVIIMFTKNAITETHGCRLEDFLVLTNRTFDDSYHTLKWCTI